MRILLTGASSFTGFWFAKALSLSGHQVIAPLRGTIEDERDFLRASRLSRLRSDVELIPEHSFGSESFLDLIRERSIDALCHHAAEVEDYRSPDFDVATAVRSNTRNLRRVLSEMGRNGLKKVVLTGSVFEYDEGAGSQPLRAFSSYGLSKGLTSEVFKYHSSEFGISFRKFVIPNPFGALEQPRLGNYLARCWMSGKVAEINTPEYIRDNIHVGLLSAAYCRFVEEAPSTGRQKLNPSGYVESQGAFVERVAREVGRRLGRECGLKLLQQTSFPEPRIRINTDSATEYVGGWNESTAWDAYAEAIESAASVA